VFQPETSVMILDVDHTLI